MSIGSGAKIGCSRSRRKRSSSTGAPISSARSADQRARAKAGRIAATAITAPLTPNSSKRAGTLIEPSAIAPKRDDSRTDRPLERLIGAEPLKQGVPRDL